MAYVSNELKAKLAPAIKAVLKKYGMNGTVSGANSSTLHVTLKSGKLDVIGNWYDANKDSPQFTRYGEYPKPEYLDVNTYWIDDHYTGTVRDFLNELVAAMKGDVWFDKSDIQSDYFHTAYYLDIDVGKWNKPYQLIA